MAPAPAAAPARRPGIALPTVSEANFALIASALLILVVIRWVPKPYPDLAAFSGDALKNVPNVMAPLVMVALFVERAVEVVMSAWRAEESQHLEAEMRAAQQEAAAGSPRPDFAALQSRMITYKATSQRLSFLVSFVISLVVAMSGVRAMEMLVVPESIKHFGSAAQTTLFVWTDVFLTATLLAGGADGLHKIVSAFTSFLDSTKQRTSGVEPTAPQAPPPNPPPPAQGQQQAPPVQAPPAAPQNPVQPQNPPADPAANAAQQPAVVPAADPAPAPQQNAPAAPAGGEGDGEEAVG
jgi:hypothetical protein